MYISVGIAEYGLWHNYGNGGGEASSLEESNVDVENSTHLHPVLRFRMSRAIPPLPYTPS
jgi:hypothetical protein